MREREINFVFFMFLIGILLSTYPFVFLLFLPLPSVNVLLLLTFVAYLVFALPRGIQPPLIVTAISYMQIIAAMISYLFVSDSEFYKQVLYIIWVNAFLSLLVLFDVKKFLFWYNRIILFVAICGVLSFFLSLLLGINIFMEFTEMDGRNGYLIWTTFTNGYVGNIIRYAGFFDEPGAMATWGMFSLVLNKLYVHDKKLEIPLMIALLFTFSVSYIIQLFCYIFFFYVLKASFRLKLFTFLFIFFAIFLFYSFVDHSSEVYSLTLGRLGIGSSYSILGDNNRLAMMRVAQKLFLSSPWFGVGVTQLATGEYAADNPFELLASHGIIGTFFIYFPMICSIIISNHKRIVLYCIMVLAIGYLQRPFHFNCLHFTMLYLFLYAVLAISQDKYTSPCNVSRV